MNWKTLAAVLAVALVAVGVLVLTTSDAGNDGRETTTISKETDADFIAGMIPHHEDAIHMAEMAQTRARHREVKGLADAIISAQQSEIERLRAANQRLFGEEPSAEEEHGNMGLDESQMGMNMDPAELETAKPFDRAFIDMMIPHHQGAIRMARVEISQGGDPELQALAAAIVQAQASEIREMNAWRQSWYGARSPAGGVPAEDESSGSTTTKDQMDDMEGM